MSIARTQLVPFGTDSVSAKNNTSFSHCVFLATFAMVVLFVYPAELHAQTGMIQTSMESTEHSPTPEELLALSLGFKRENVTDFNQLTSMAMAVDKMDPMWPVYAFLTAQTYESKGNSFKALGVYRDLVVWAASDPYRDKRGTNGLVSIALWRWTKSLIESKSLDTAQVEEVLSSATVLLRGRLIQGMFATELLSSLPQLEEDLLKSLAVIAWRSSNRPRAQRLLLDYFAVARTDFLKPEEIAIRQAILDSHMASPDRLKLYQGKRLKVLGQREPAERLLREVCQGTDPQARAEAALYLAGLVWIQQRPNWMEECCGLLDFAIEGASNPEIQQEALFKRAITARAHGQPSDISIFQNNLIRLIDTFPLSKYAADSLHQLGFYYSSNGDIDKSLEYYRRLRAFQGEDPLLENGFIIPALTLYIRGNPGDREEAYKLLDELNTTKSNGAINPRGLFWAGRIAAELGVEEAARRHFSQIVDATPWDFYAIRARMHIQSLSNKEYCASQELWPPKEVLTEIRSSYQPVSKESELSSTIYHVRLQQALQKGLYKVVLSSETRFHELKPLIRLEEAPMEELDKMPLFPSLVILLSFRQDAYAAKEKVQKQPGDEVTPVSIVANRIQVANAILKYSEDWPLIIMVVGHDIEERSEYLQAIEHNPHYLATVYPCVNKEDIITSSLKWHVPSELLYAIARTESFFFPAALSEEHAMGLFQFWPSTLNALNKRWNLTPQPTALGTLFSSSALQYDLGARWFHEEVLPPYKEYPEFFGIMAHHAGSPAVKKWVGKWQRENRLRDVEYMLETIQVGASRMFVTHVLTDMTLTKAIGLYTRD